MRSLSWSRLDGSFTTALFIYSFLRFSPLGAEKIRFLSLLFFALLILSARTVSNRAVSAVAHPYFLPGILGETANRNLWEEDEAEATEHYMPLESE